MMMTELEQHQPRSSILERGRAIRLLRNGDAFFQGRSFVINQRKYPMLEVFLDDASQTMRANFGAVRCIYTPKTGTRVRDISDFEDHHTYVAGGAEKFKKLHYLDIAEGKRNQKDRTSPRLPPVRRMDVEGRALKLARSENVIIYVYRNGDPLTLPAKILLVKSTLANWESVLDEITRKVSLTNTAVLKLYAMNGELITSAQQMEYNGMYVAAGKERFKRIDYPDPKTLSPNSSPKMSRKSYSNSNGTNTHTTTATSNAGSIDGPHHRRPVREEYDFFNNKPQQHRRGPPREIDLDRDDGGVFKSKGVNYRDRVREVEDTKDTKVDLPVGFREIETVDDEQLYGAKTPRHYRHDAQEVINQKNRQVLTDVHRSPVRTIKSPISNYEDKFENQFSNQNGNYHHKNNKENHSLAPISLNSQNYNDNENSDRGHVVSSGTQVHEYDD
ncbi:unnamed protein product [Didymodactylos carnosus]|uniref:Doublecortin domain-containing protein n=1 Tax=Didymodactylos carnosus TaxID=1234261 RepID=A0A813TGB7_9BILA|nr:unnamed protein product [Didymodactylos carnosus]CAF0899310.1 unnamed protein product [Didymodactylos carnosus]CAF3594510.1 unnamed protein product [Didymodactylos carnosus]CAF3680293.1 unnamed protein product [Didymodactylos carnosus]